MWPGYGENSRVLKWVFECVNGTADTGKTAIGYLPNATSLEGTCSLTKPTYKQFRR
jgi:phosphoenolpyruvate carboxykinase (GTP)